MGRLQQGYSYEAFYAFHLRYYVIEIVDGQLRRAQRSQRLCDEGKCELSLAAPLQFHPA
jgi:hypothetical protein